MPCKKMRVWTTLQGTTRIIPDATALYQRTAISLVQRLSALFADRCLGTHSGCFDGGKGPRTDRVLLCGAATCP
jgi:hypothetical protein